MSTLNVGAMAARLGLDPSDFLDKMKGVEGFASGSGQRIAAEMKRTSREGAESLRLIDEALGVHLSRPVTRIISQEFPALASGLSSILGAGVFGAITFAGVEAFDKLSEKMEKAQKAQEAYRESLDKLKTSFDEVMAGYAKSTAERGLTGIDKELFKIDTHSLEEARHQLDDLSKDSRGLGEERRRGGSGLWTRALAAIGDAGHIISLIGLYSRSGGDEQTVWRVQKAARRDRNRKHRQSNTRPHRRIKSCSVRGSEGS